MLYLAVLFGFYGLVLFTASGATADPDVGLTEDEGYPCAYVYEPSILPSISQPAQRFTPSLITGRRVNALPHLST